MTFNFSVLSKFVCLPFFILDSRLLPVFIAFFAASFMSFIDFCSSVGYGERIEGEEGGEGEEGRKREKGETERVCRSDSA